jgi:hypothetical protein
LGFGIADQGVLSEDENLMQQQFQIPDYGHAKTLIYRSILIMVKFD